jgi:hypothetical protein
MGPLLENIPGVKQFCHRWNDVPGHAAHCRLSSLPYLFHTMPDTIPAQVPYLKPNPARVAHWRERLNALLPAGRKRIGLAWTGRPTHPNDKRRSMPLSRLVPLASAGNAAFVSLQKPMPAADKATLSSFGMTDLADELTDFGETAAVMESLDLIITVDTAMGHLAGALGRPVWILIPKAADWRWMLDRSDSPWYPTARLFRQDRPGAWDKVIQSLRDALAQDLAQAGHAQAGHAQAGHSQAGHSQASPVQAGHAQAGHAQASPARASPTQASPTQASPVQASPVQASPAQASPAQASPAQATRAPVAAGAAE